MTNTMKRFTQISTAMLAASALLAPTLSVAATSVSAPTAVAMNTETKPATEFRKMNKMLEKLNLSAEQREKIDAQLETSKPKMADLHEEMRANKEAIKAQQFSDSYNAATVKSLADKQGGYVSQMIVMRSDVNNKIYAILTPEQRAQLHAMEAEKSERKTNRTKK